MLEISIGMGARNTAYRALLETHLTTKRKVVTEEYPTIHVGDWYVTYNPSTTARCCKTGVPLPWRAGQSSRFYDCVSLEGLLEALKEDETEE